MAKTVLIVEDNELNMKLFHDLLEAHGYSTVGTRNGIEALERALSQPFDLVIVDVNMPRMDGLTFLRALRRSAADVAVLPALMISTESETQDIAAARAAGANFYLVKPVAEAELVRHVCVLTGAIS